MKKIVKKNQVVITALAALIAVAGYLNFADVDLGGTDKEASAEGTNIVEDIESLDYDLSDETAVLSENAEEGNGEAQDETTEDTGETADAGEEMDSSSETPGEAVLTGSSNFVAQARINREQIRSQNKASLQEIIDNAELSQDQKAEAVNSMVEITEMVEKEAAAELLLEAKGFQDVVVNLTGETADVVVPDSNVDDASRAQIEDIVQRKTGIAPEYIVISPMSDTE